MDAIDGEMLATNLRIDDSTAVLTERCSKLEGKLASITDDLRGRIEASLTHHSTLQRRVLNLEQEVTNVRLENLEPRALVTQPSVPSL